MIRRYCDWCGNEVTEDAGSYVDLNARTNRTNDSLTEQICSVDYQNLMELRNRIKQTVIPL